MTHHRGPEDDEEASEVTFTFELSESADGVDLTVVDEPGVTTEETGSGETGEKEIEVELDERGSGQPTANFPLEVTAEIHGGECLTATISDSDDTVTLADDDWSEC